MSISYVCSNCGYKISKWTGKCPSCNEWNSFNEDESDFYNAKKINKANNLVTHKITSQSKEYKRLFSGNSEFDRICGGGIVVGSATLIGGDPGIGKSTLLLQISMQVALLGHKVLYVSGEESINQIQMRAMRINNYSDEEFEKIHAHFLLSNGANLEEIIATAEHEKPKLIIIDSIQTLHSENIPSSPGTVPQLRYTTSMLTNYAKANNIIIFFIGHVTKDGQIAGPKLIEHLVDCVFYFEQNNLDQLRLLRSIKNRFGPTSELGVFEMKKNGLAIVENPSEIFLQNRNVDCSGSAIFAGIQGSRPILIEMQALITSSSLVNPRRAVVGWDNSRLAMIIAVLEKRANMRLSANDIYVNSSGGIKITEPGVDLAVAAAIISSQMNKNIPKNYIFMGEVALSGIVSNVSFEEERINEAQKLGFKNIVKAKSKNENITNFKINIINIEKIIDLLELIKSF